MLVVYNNYHFNDSPAGGWGGWGGLWGGGVSWLRDVAQQLAQHVGINLLYLVRGGDLQQSDRVLCWQPIKDLARPVMQAKLPAHGRVAEWPGVLPKSSKAIAYNQRVQKGVFCSFRDSTVAITTSMLIPT